VAAFRIVESFDVVEHIGLRLIPRSAHLARCTFGLQRREEALHLRAASGRARLHRWHHDCEGLRGGLAATDAGDVRTAGASPGHAQADFGEAIGIIGGVERKIHFFAFDLPHSDAGFVVGYTINWTASGMNLSGN
jgi:hypothetical protein